MTSDFGKRLLRCLQHRGKRPIDLANGTGLSKGNISKWINGARPMPKLPTLQKIADYLEVDIAYLMGISDSMIKQVYKVHQHIGEKTEEELLLDELHANMTWLNKEELRMLNEMVKTLVKGRK